MLLKKLNVHFPIFQKRERTEPISDELYSLLLILEIPCYMHFIWLFLDKIELFTSIINQVTPHLGSLVMRPLWLGTWALPDGIFLSCSDSIPNC